MLAVAKFTTEEEAIGLANDTSYGLGAGLHSSASRFLIMARTWEFRDFTTACHHTCAVARAPVGFSLASAYS